MRIKVKKNVAGVDCSFSIGEYTVGEGQLTEALAHEFLSCGIADVVSRDPIQVATAPAPEVAVSRGRNSRGRGHRAEPDAS